MKRADHKSVRAFANRLGQVVHHCVCRENVAEMSVAPEFAKTFTDNLQDGHQQVSGLYFDNVTRNHVGGTVQISADVYSAEGDNNGHLLGEVTFTYARDGIGMRLTNTHNRGQKAW